MKNLPTFARAAQLAGVTAIALAAAAPARAQIETPIHRFDGAPTDGGNAFQTVIKVGNKLYGLTQTGGAFGLGAFYSLPLAGGGSTLLYSFKGGPADGAYPRGNLINVGGMLYGTTAAGGTGTNCSSPYTSCGTVFSITTTGIETPIYSFQGGTDGSAPFGTLLNVGGVLYGTTLTGGSLTCVTSYPSCGTVFNFNLTSSIESVVYRFQGGTDGANPTSTLIKSGPYVYGTTGYGGGACTIVNQGCGTVFRVKISNGVEYVLHRFSYTDGFDPIDGALVKVGSSLWGTTWFGGPNNGGAAYAIPIGGGAETYNYSFTAGLDGGNPLGGLVAYHGALYGTTEDGGISGCQFVYPYTDGCGTIFKIDPASGQPPATLYSFQGGTDGGNPATGMTLAGKTLIGTTYGDGNSTGTGTVFTFIP
jgi:uncharacterized repeat protein (TIGR03803 family)